jgi:hypothetical protein
MIAQEDEDLIIMSLGCVLSEVEEWNSKSISSNNWHKAVAEVNKYIKIFLEDKETVIAKYMAMLTIYDIADYANNLVDNGYDDSITIGEDIIIEFMENLYDVFPDNVAFDNIENSLHFIKQCTAERIELIIFERTINKLQKEYPSTVKDITKMIEASKITFPDSADYSCYHD